jgi:ElaB/YqjD/DUF883 family membrane-anchored ribosome-binding protein
MTEQRLKVESGPPEHVIAEAQTPPQSHEEPGKTEQVKDKAQQVAAPAAEKAQQVKESAQETVAPAKQKARDVASQAKGHAQAAAEQAKGNAAAQVDEKSTQAGEQIGSQAEALEGVAGELRKQGKEGPAKVAEQAAEKVKGVGDYLQQADGESLVQAAQDVARENPAAAAAVGAAAGFVAGRVIKASSADDDDGEPTAPPPDAATPDPGAGAP